MTALNNFCVRCREFTKGKFMTIADFVCDQCIDEEHTIYLTQEEERRANE